MLTLILPSMRPTQTSPPSSVYLQQEHCQLYWWYNILEISSFSQISIHLWCCPHLRLNISPPHSTELRTRMLPSATGPPKSGPPRNDLRVKVGNSRTCWRQTYVDYQENLDIERIIIAVSPLPLSSCWWPLSASTWSYFDPRETREPMLEARLPARLLLWSRDRDLVVFYVGWCYSLSK